MPPPSAFAEAHHVGHHAAAGGDPAWARGESGLHLVVDQERAFAVQQIADHGEISVVGRDDARVHHHRLEDHRGHLPAVLGERARHRPGVVERHHDDEIADRGRDAGVAGNRVRPVARADLVGLGQHRDLDRVVVPVIAALDLDDHVPSGKRSGQVNRIHSGFGAGVGEPPQRQLEATRQLAGDPDRVLGRLREMRSAPYPVADRGDDRRMSVPGDGGAVAAVHVDVLGPVDVVHLRAEAMAHPDGLRLGDLPVRRRATGQVHAGLGDEFGAARLAAQKHLLLVGDQLVYGVGHCAQISARHYRRRHEKPPVQNG